MRYLLQFVIFSLFSTVFGFVEILFMKGVPRLNNSTYCDYYFACHAEGEILQWIVNDSTISNYSGQSTLGSVLSHSTSNCNYITTLLSLMVLSGMSEFNSVLIISCQSSTSLNVGCTNGSTLSEAQNPEKSPTTMAENNGTSVNLEHVLNGHLINADTSICTNVFLCGVDNDFMTWKAQGRTSTFSFHDSVGVKRQKLRGSMVEQQAILIDTKPYSLVVALFIIDSPLVNVTCGYNGNTADLSSMSCLTNLGTTEPEAMDTTEPEAMDTTEPEAVDTTESKTTGSMISSTVDESSTMASGGSIILPVILGLSITLGVVIVVAGIIIAVLSCLYNKRRNLQNYVHSLEMRFIGRSFYRVEPDGPRTSYKELPLKNNDFNGIKMAKPKMDNVDYEQKFFNRVQYIFLVRNEHTFTAATTFLTAPDIEKGSNELTDIDKGAATTILTAPDIENTTYEQLTCIDEDIYIGMIGDHPVCLVNESGNELLQKLEKVITNYFINAKYLVFFSTCFGINREEVKLGDIMISKSILHVTRDFAATKLIPPKIRSAFCFYPEINGLEVAKGRLAEHFVCKIASGENISNDEALREQALIACEDIKGCVDKSGELFNLSKYKNITVRQMQAITIGAVTGYVEKDYTVTMYDEWQFMASQAAFHYVTSKLKEPHTSGNILYDIKKTKIMNDKRKCSEFVGKVQFVILTVSSDEFNAVKTKLSKPGSEETIMEIDLDMLIGETESHPSEIDLDIFIGEIGSHSIGLLYLKKPVNYVANMKFAIVKCFRHAKYLVHVGGISGIKNKKSDLGDVLISNKLCNIYYSDESYSTKDIEVTQEIKEIFDNSNSPVIGLELPGSRRAKHSMVKIAIGAGEYIEHNERMKKVAIKAKQNYGYNVIGGYLLQLQGIMGLAKEDKRDIHFILVNGVRSYNDSRNYDEWDFVASQAAINYVAAKIEKHRQPIVG